MLYLSLSLPPTSNHRLMPTTRGRGLGLTKGPKYRAWMNREAARIAYGLPESFQTLSEPVISLVHVTFPDNRRRDLDNVLKPLNDVLVKAKVLQDDRLVQTQIVDRGPANKDLGGLVEVFIWAASEPMGQQWQKQVQEALFYGAKQ